MGALGPQGEGQKGREGLQVNPAPEGRTLDTQGPLRSGHTLFSCRENEDECWRLVLKGQCMLCLGCPPPTLGQQNFKQARWDRALTPDLEVQC